MIEFDYMLVVCSLHKIHSMDKNNNISENMASSVVKYSKNIWKSFYFPKTCFSKFSCPKNKNKNRFSYICFDLFSKNWFSKNKIIISSLIYFK